jgi:hypothetical protein
MLSDQAPEMVREVPRWLVTDGPGFAAGLYAVGARDGVTPASRPRWAYKTARVAALGVLILMARAPGRAGMVLHGVDEGGPRER